MKIKELDGNKQQIINNSKDILVVYDYRGMPKGREIRLQPGQVVVIQKAPKEDKIKEEVIEPEKEEYKPKKKKSEKAEDEKEDKSEDSINTSLTY